MNFTKRGLEKCKDGWIGIRKGICKEKPRKRRITRKIEARR
jgi:hypothetical protein